MQNYHWLIYLVAFFVGFSTSILTTPLAKKISIKFGAIDKPKKRGVSKREVPRLGGIAIILGFMASMLVLIPFVEEFRTLQFAGIAAGALIIAILGIFDDIKDLNSKLKFFVQLIASLIVVLSGTRIEMIVWPVLESNPIIQTFSIPLTIMWIIGVTNAVNLIDGVDGLAAGVSSISSLFIMVLCILTGEPLAVIFSAALAGSSLGFLPRNFNPAEIYMGDTGATFLGFVLAVTSVMGLFKTYTLLAILIAILVLALPILDTLSSIIRRLINHKPIMSADRGHFHHRLIDSGFTQKQTVFILYAVTAIAGIISILIVVANPLVSAVGITFLFVVWALVNVYRKSHKNDKEQ
ncbi:MAG: undecaprenyl/decaprenyl-phosphate alpha-N-acetylglucosaminyl 1-phosphate transferase [Defluviitaleaceae bacterium]|nr:undecaprenyl/decaprenyl-phosphate alpha-N-acetylglucosaminyl 1-phosphate transferase [Defluviitaleaceae bacterium]